MIYKILTVIGLATFEIYAAIPAGFAFKLHPVEIFSYSVFVAAYLGDIIKKWISSLRKTKVNKVAKEPGFVLKIWEKYGVIGLGLLGTMSVGAPISIGIGVSFNVPTNKMVFWCSLGVVLRCVIFTAIGYFGLKLI